jgi:sugar/nucleoside kinase (ribokinase family)
MGLKYDVIVVGDYCLDLIFTGLPKFPQLGLDIVGTGFEMIPGGGGYNSAVTMHRLGLSVGWAGDFGNDDFSQFVLKRAAAEGLDEGLYVHHKRPLRRISVAVSYPEERAFISYNDPDPPVPAGLKALALASAKVFSIPGVFYGRELDAGLLMIRAKGMKLVMDGNAYDNVSLEMPEVVRAIRSVDLFIPNKSEACRFTGEDRLDKAIRKLGELCPFVVVKAGAEGTYGYFHGELTHVPALEIEPLDTTGAGDCFDAGFIKAWLDKRPLEECLKWGNITGGLSTLAPGGTGYPITTAVVEEWLKKYQ